MNPEDIERVFQKLNAYNYSLYSFDKEIVQKLSSELWDPHKQGESMRNPCEMDEETAERLGLKGNI